MKKLSLLLATLFIYSFSFAQVSSYTFGYSAGTYTPLVGGTALVPAGSGITGAGWFEQVFNVQLPFVYYFNGAGYSSIYVNSNGHIAFGKPTLVTNPRPNTVNNGQSGAIIGYGCNTTYSYTGGAGSILLGGLVDLPNSNPIMAGTIGSAPNRIFVVQWTNAVRSVTYYPNNGAGFTENLTFQIRLKEGSNVAEIVYDNSATTYSPTFNATSGLSGAATTDYNLVTGTAWNTVTNGTSGTLNIPFTSSVSIPAGTTFTFTPNVGQMPTACSGAPAPATTVATTGITCGSVGLSLVGLPLSTGLTYQWQKSSTGLAGSWTNISGATNATLNAALAASTYFQCLVACGAGSSVASSSVAVGYESSCPTMPSYSYSQSGGYPYSNIGNFQIAGTACGSTFNDVANSLSNFNYPPFSGSSGTAYAYVDYTASANRIKLLGSTSGSSSFTASTNNYGANASVVGVWIDLNDNGSFLDANEYVGSAPSVLGAATAFTITIPANNFGIHRLRIRSAWNAIYSVSSITPTGLLSSFGQSNDYTVEIVPPAPTPSTTSPVCVTGTLTLTSPAITGSTIYTWTGPSGYSATTTGTSQNYVVPSTAASGTYSLTTTVSGANPCAAGTTVVTVNPQPSLTGTTNNGPVCAGDVLNLTAGTASNVTGYSWTGPVSITTPGSANATVPAALVAATGTYSVAVNNGTGSGCTVTYTTAATVKVSPDVSVFIIPFATTPCQGAISTVTVNSTSLPAGSYQVTYDLSGSNIATGLVASITMSGTSGTFTTSALANAGPTTLTITSITNSVLCTKALSTGNTIVITVNPLPTTITGTNSVCEGRITSLFSAGAGTWTSGTSTIATATGSGT
ncbi:MAG: hypothetical protein JWQ38_3814, partial [Flavipsychrobacter sp.]|nr:hypothetical protein [Flavipsychrobacter sp.]